MAISYHTNAAYVDHGTYLTDDTTTLDWLKLSESFNESLGTAEGNNHGWRLANNDEVVDMFWKFFPDFETNTAQGHRYIYDVNGSPDIGLVNNFRTTWGTSGTVSVGRYVDENGADRDLGVNRSIDGTGTWIFGPDFTIERPADFAGPNHGIFMVRGDWGDYDPLPRAQVVPIPAAIWLFGTGLLGLVAVARRKA